MFVLSFQNLFISIQQGRVNSELPNKTSGCHNLWLDKNPLTQATALLFLEFTL